MFVGNGGKRGKMNPVDESTPRGESKGYCREPVKNGEDQWKHHAKKLYRNNLVGRGISLKTLVKGAYIVNGLETGL